MASELTDAERRRILWEQFVEVHAESQEAYDNSVRTIAAAGVGITASLATALHGITSSGIAAISLFLLSLGLNLGSYGTAQLDMHARTEALRKHDEAAAETGNAWSVATTVLNILAGAAVLVGGALLAWFVGANA